MFFFCLGKTHVLTSFFWGVKFGGGLHFELDGDFGCFLFSVFFWGGMGAGVVWFQKKCWGILVDFLSDVRCTIPHSTSCAKNFCTWRFTPFKGQEL